MSFLENYVKVALYAYPILQTVSEDYAEHIRNKALLSYDSGKSAEQLAVYLAEEILQKEKLEQLRGILERVLRKLSDGERALLALRYFGKRKATKETLRGKEIRGEDLATLTSRDRSYFRQLERLGRKVGAMLVAEGFTKERYLQDYADVEWIAKIHRFVERGEEKRR